MDIVKEAAEIAQATEFIETKSAKYESPIVTGWNIMYLVDRSKDFQLQWAIAKNPKIFIFDDSFSALEFKDRCGT